MTVIHEGDPFAYEPPSARRILTDQGVPEDVIDGVLAVHAHELAVEIRSEADDDPVVPVYGGKRGPVRNSLLWAADLIDPAVTK